jgi:hypothetical protein
MTNRKPYPREVSDKEWPFVAPDLTLFVPGGPTRCNGQL